MNSIHVDASRTRALLWCSRSVPAGTYKNRPPPQYGRIAAPHGGGDSTAGAVRGAHCGGDEGIVGTALRSIHPCPPCYPSRALLWWLASASPRRLVVNPVRAGRQQRQRRCRVPEPELVRAASLGRASPSRYRQGQGSLDLADAPQGAWKRAVTLRLL